MTGVPVRGGDKDTDTERNHVKTEKTTAHKLKAGEKSSLPEPSSWTSRLQNCGKYISGVQGPQSVVLCYGSPS